MWLSLIGSDVVSEWPNVCLKTVVVGIAFMTQTISPGGATQTPPVADT